MIAAQETGTRVDEVAAGIYRISTPLDVIPGGFTINSYLIADEEPLLFHTGYRGIFPITLEAIRKVRPVEKLRWIGGSHFEADEYGAPEQLVGHCTGSDTVWRRNRCPDIPQRFCGAACARSGRWGGVFHRRTPHEVDVYTARSSRLGLRHTVRSVHQYAAVRGSVYARERLSRRWRGAAPRTAQHAR